MNLVMGRLSDNASFSPATGSKSQSGPNNVLTRSAIRTGVKTLTNKEMGNSAGAYARMEDSAAGIHLQDLKHNDVLKTTTTEVRSERRENVAEDIGSLESVHGKTSRKSVSSSEVHIMDYDRV
jgi:hypothetical protein